MKNVCSTFEHYVLNHNVLLLYIITWMDSESRGISIVRYIYVFYFFFFLFYYENNIYDVARMIHWYEILRIK